MGVLDGTEILLDGQTYRLLRETLANKLSRRRWQVERQRLAMQRRQRPDVRPGEMEGDYIIAWGDWSKGICGDHENLPGCLHYAEGAHGLIPGALRPAWTEDYRGMPVTTDQESAPAAIVEWGLRLFYLMGRYAYVHESSQLLLDHDLGAGTFFLGGDVHNDKLIATVTGASTALRAKSGTAGAWSTSADVTGTLHVTPVENRLWRASNYEVSNIGPTDNPLTLVSWSAGIRVGPRADATELILALMSRGERVVAATRRAVYMGDRSAIFPNILPRLEATTTRDGRRSITRGADIFYVHRDGLMRITESRIEEVGIAQHFPTANLNDRLPGMEITALCTDGRNLWAATRASTLPTAKPVRVMNTHNNGSSYIDLTAAVTDSSAAYLGATAISGWDTLANGDYLLVGYSAPFYGITLDLQQVNDTLSQTAAAYVTAAGTPVVATTLPAVCAYTDAMGGEPTLLYTAKAFRYSGALMWSDRGTDLASWVPVTINGTNAYWMRFTVSAAISSITLDELRVITQDHRAHVWRGRPWQPGDVRGTSVIWEPYTILEGCSVPTAIATVTNSAADYNSTGGLSVLAKQRVFHLRREWDLHNPGYMAYPGGGRIISAKHDGGSPEVRKQFNYFRIKGRILDATHTVKLEYRLDETDTWLLALDGINTNSQEVPLTAAIGRAIQWRLTFNAFTGDRFTEINEIECGYREIGVWKNVGTYSLELYDGCTTSDGAMLPDSDVQLTALESLQGDRVVPLRDATHRLKSVTVEAVREMEVFQEMLDYPVLAVEVVTAEV